MRFNGQTCIYCNKNPSTPTGDHIFARGFFLVHRRNNLPKVPCCKACGDEKSRLEHYLMERLPFGGRHVDAAINLSSMIPRRFAQNKRAHREIGRGASHTWHRERSGLMVRRMTVPIDGSKIEALFVFITKALMWHHWKVKLGDDTFMQCVIPTFAQIKKIVDLMRHNAAQRVHENVGHGTFIYAGAQGVGNPVISVWEFAIYGGVDLAGGVRPNELVSRIYAMTGPLRVSQQADQRIKSGAFILRP